MGEQILGNTQGASLLSALAAVLARKQPPDGDTILRLIDAAQHAEDTQSEQMRPRDVRGRRGGLIRLVDDLPTVIVPDLHARADFLYSIFAAQVGDGLTLSEALARGDVQVVCVGDAFHTERRGAQRWKRALDEYQKGFKKHEAMDAEMRDSFGVIEMVLEAKIAFPGRFHFLKGNHENIANESGDGNHGFRKYALEGPMVRDYVTRFYGETFLQRYYEFEKSLPLLVIGTGFLISHAEPATFFEEARVINFRDDPEVIEGLTWTDNGAAEEQSVQQMLEHYLGDTDASRTVYFGGHRPVGGLYTKRADDQYIQFHNPDRFIVVRIVDGSQFHAEQDVLEIPDRSAEALGKERRGHG